MDTLLYVWEAGSTFGCSGGGVTTLYQDETGYFCGFWKEWEGWWITELMLLPRYRGKGLGKKLASHLPRRCRLLAGMWHRPLVDGFVPAEEVGPSLTTDQLVQFYESLGFGLYPDLDGHAFMRREK